MVCLCQETAYRRSKNNQRNRHLDQCFDAALNRPGWIKQALFSDLRKLMLKEQGDISPNGLLCTLMKD